MHLLRSQLQDQAVRSQAPWEDSFSVHATNLRLLPILFGTIVALSELKVNADPFPIDENDSRVQQFLTSDLE